MNVRLPKPEPKQAEVSLGNLYDVNKQLMEHEAALTNEDISTKIIALSNWFYYEYPSTKYYMLLCNEQRDFTLFNVDAKKENPQIKLETSNSIATDVIECMTNRGQLLSIDLQPDNVWELWIRIDDACFAYYLFPYDDAVIEYGG